MASKRLLWITPAALALILPGACSLTVDLEGLSGGPPKPGPGGGAGGAGSDAGAACVNATYPPPPESATEGGSLDFTVAVRSIDIGEMTGVPSGLDLDKTCTCQFDEGPSCIYPPYATKDHCDDKEGRDNSVAKVIETVQLFVGPEEFGSKHFSDRAESGSWSLLVRVYNYNGEPNDAQVTIAIYPSKWNDATIPEPTWDGNDVWPAAATSLEDGITLEKPRFTDPKGYVTDGVLVASVPEVLLNLNATNGDLGFLLTAGTVMGTLAEVNGRYKLTNGIVAARWRITDAFKVISAIKVGNQQLCKNESFEYQQFKGLLCSHVDIASTLGGPSTDCDSLSFGMKFEAEPVLLGSPFMPEEDQPPCPPEQDPATDTCD
jgi:hypothetical protein